MDDDWGTYLPSFHFRADDIQDFADLMAIGDTTLTLMSCKQAIRHHHKELTEANKHIRSLDECIGQKYYELSKKSNYSRTMLNNQCARLVSLKYGGPVWGDDYSDDDFASERCYELLGFLVKLEAAHILQMPELSAGYETQLTTKTEKRIKALNDGKYRQAKILKLLDFARQDNYSRKIYSDHEVFACKENGPQKGQAHIFHLVPYQNYIFRLEIPNKQAARELEKRLNNLNTSRKSRIDSFSKAANENRLLKAYITACNGWTDFTSSTIETIAQEMSRHKN